MSVGGIKCQRAQGLGCFPGLVGSKPGRLGDDDAIYLDQGYAEGAYVTGDMWSKSVGWQV